MAKRFDQPGEMITPILLENIESFGALLRSLNTDQMDFLIGSSNQLRIGTSTLTLPGVTAASPSS